jgi:murein DD-endopeptidase MepM/ murein hydrolase activator NlpD
METINFEERLKLYTGEFAKVVPLLPDDKLLQLDFTAGNTELTREILDDTAKFSAYINRKLEGYTYGVGGYNEHRTIYKRSHVFDTSFLPPTEETESQQVDADLADKPPLESTSEEPRRLHLGIDIWGPAETPIYAPLEGTVHSFAFNDAYGDYGATLILQHDINGFIFHTLYGHLSLASIQDKLEGQTITKGEWIAAFGVPAENGQWPPHLHFQLIIDMQGMKGDYPGVCKYSEREKYLENCPNADLILEMMRNVAKS